jgi:hypothetical protein
MPDKIWNEIDKIVKSLEEIPSNREIFEKYPETAESMVLSAVFHSALKIPEDVYERISGLKDQIGGKLPGIIHEYFLDTGNLSEQGASQRKKRGIYYTPDCVAEYITNRTIGKKLEDSLSKLNQFAKDSFFPEFIEEWEKTASIKILDPACGWGIFLLCAYTLMENFYTKAAAAAELIKKSLPKKHIEAPNLDNRQVSSPKAAFREKIESIIKTGNNPAQWILKNNIFGFDIDSTAAGIAGNLLRRSGTEQKRTSGRQGVLFEGYEHNIITLDFINQYEEIKEKFDFIIGNPPYFTIGGGGKGKSRTGYHQAIKEHPVFSPYFKSQSDIFYYFIIGGAELLAPGGTLSFITPSYWMDNEHADALRRYISEECLIKEIVKFEPIKVFKARHGGAPGVDASVVTLQKKPEGWKPQKQPAINGQITIDFIDAGNDKEAGQQTKLFADPGFDVFVPDESVVKSGTQAYLNLISSGELPPGQRLNIRQEALTSGRWSFNSPDPIFSKLIKDGERVFPLGDVSAAEWEKYRIEFEEGRGYGSAGICNIGQGQETGMSEVFLIDRGMAEALELEPSGLKPNIKNGQIKSFFITDSDQVMIFLTDEDDIEQYPKIKTYLEPFHRQLETRQRVQKGVRKWYAVSIPQNISVFDQPVKIVVPYRSSENRFAVDTGRHFNDGGDVRGLVIKKKFLKRLSHEALASILNSSLIAAWYQKYGKRKGNVFEFFTLPMSRIPIILPDTSQKAALEKLYYEISDIKKSTPLVLNIKRNPEPGGAIERVARKIRQLESDIDNIVFDLYGIRKNLND